MEKGESEKLFPIFLFLFCINTCVHDKEKYEVITTRYMIIHHNFMKYTNVSLNTTRLNLI